MGADDELFSSLEQEYADTRIITIVKRDEGPPQVQYDEGLSEAEVVATVLKALIFMTLDEWVMDVFDNFGVDFEDDSDLGDDE